MPPRTPLRPLLAPAVLACLTLLAACGSAPEPPRFQALTEGLVPGVPVTALALPEGTRLVAAEEAGGAWIVTALPASAWSRIGPSVWRAPRRFAGTGRPRTGPPQQLSTRDGAYGYVARAARTVTEQPGLFCATGNEVVVMRPEGAGPPGDAVLREFLRLSRDDGERRRVALGPLVGDGIPLVPGTTEHLVVHVAPHSALTFWTGARGGGTTPPDARMRFVLRADGATLLDHEQELVHGLSFESHTLPLPAAGGRVQLELSAEGPPALAAVYDPVVHPLAVGTRGGRPWGQQHPDIVLFQADTFRADNLAAYGGPAWLAPNVDRFAKEALCFTHARSNASWTLPAVVTLFTGLMPQQAACTGPGDRLADEVQTLAERLRAAGYRTVAITDQGFVSRSHGFAQGFEWFFELGRRGEGSLEGTLRDVRTQLEVDDGRPLFLFVQTYRAHVPYAVSDATRAELGDRLGIEKTWDELSRTVSINTIHAGDAGFDDFTRAAEALYRGGVHDLDRGFGQFLDLLGEEGLGDGAYTCFFSDHGEAFGEGGVWGHGTNVHDSQLRVPLLLRGPGVVPASASVDASLLDLHATVLRLAGLEPLPGIPGRSLLELAQDDPAATTRWVTSVQGDAAGSKDGGALARTRGTHKLVLRGVDRPDEIVGYALDRDPGEEAPLSAGDAPWVRTAADALRVALPALLAPRFRSDRAELSASERRGLDDLGYGGH